MKKLLATTLISIISLGSTLPAYADTVLNGAGATFPYPIYSKWFDEYHKSNPDVKINYQSIGSGGGVKQFTAKTVDFGATDGPMNQKELFAVDGKSIHVPTVLGAVVPTYNIGTADELQFTGDVLAKIYLGTIKTWDDAAIKALNPNVKLPSDPITVVRRADGSGTTYCFTDYLSSVSPDWKKQVGTGKAVNWPVGLGGKGNEGVAGLVKQTRGAIGYVELIYAKNNNLSYGAVQNKSGKFVKADVASVSEAAANVEMPKDFRVSIVNASGEKSYPISTFTWILVYESNGGKKGQVLKSLMNWILDEGQKMAPELGYAPLPTKVREMIKARISSIS